MKKTLLLAVVALFTIVNVNAQEKEKSAEGFKGTWWALGQLEYSDDDATDTSSFTILPVVGTFVAPTVTVGMGVGYTTTTVGNADAVDAVVLMPLARKYWGMSDKFFLFAQADVPVTLADTVNTYGFNLRPGVDYFIGGKFTIEATFGAFGYNVTDPDVGDATNKLSLGFNSMDLNFGLKMLF